MSSEFRDLLIEAFPSSCLFILSKSINPHGPTISIIEFPSEASISGSGGAVILYPLRLRLFGAIVIPAMDANRAIPTFLTWPLFRCLGRNDIALVLASDLTACAASGLRT